jgi:hypothetical protein
MLKPFSKFDPLGRKWFRFESWKIFAFPFVRVSAGNAAISIKSMLLFRRENGSRTRLA